MGYSGNTLKRIQQQAEMFEKSIRHLIPEDCDIELYISAGGFVTLNIDDWDRTLPKSLGTRRRRKIVNTSRLNGQWSEDGSDEDNRYYAKQGVLLMKGVSKSA